MFEMCRKGEESECHDEEANDIQLKGLWRLPVWRRASCAAGVIVRGLVCLCWILPALELKTILTLSVIYSTEGAYCLIFTADAFPLADKEGQQFWIFSK